MPATSNRSHPSLVTLVAALTTLGACESGRAPGSARAHASAAQMPAATSSSAAKTAQTKPAAVPSDHVEFPDNVSWHTWEEGQAIARRESKPIMVVVYADWCPKCRSLTPVFRRPDVEKLAKQMVLVRQNHDDEPAWLEPFNQKYGGYVPRIFFFGPDGTLRQDVTSGHPRYPYFYAAQDPESLTRSMQTAIGT